MYICESSNTATASGGTDAPLDPEPQPGGAKLAMWSTAGDTMIGTINVNTCMHQGGSNVHWRRSVVIVGMYSSPRHIGGEKEK